MTQLAVGTHKSVSRDSHKTCLQLVYLLVFPGSLELAHKKGGTIKYGCYHEYSPAAFCYCISLLVNTIVALLHEELVVGASVLIRKVSVIQGPLSNTFHLWSLQLPKSCTSHLLLAQRSLPSLTRHKTTTAKDTAALFQIMVAQSALTEPQAKDDCSRLSLVVE